MGGIAGKIAVGVDVDDLGQLVVVEHRKGQDQLADVGRAGRKGVTLGADHGAERGDELLADGVERRVGHLGKELAEVVEDQSWAAGQHGDRAVGAHRPQGLSPGLCHGRQQDPQLFLRVTERLLAARD